MIRSRTTHRVFASGGPALVVLVAFAAAPTPAQAPPDYYAPERLREFAEYLFQRGDYVRAAGEYQRYLFVTDLSAGRDSVLFRIGLAYRLGGQPRRAIAALEEALALGRDLNLREACTYQIARAQLDLGEYRRSIETLKAHPPASREFRQRYTNLRAVNHLRLREWDAAYCIVTASGQSEDPRTDSLSAALAEYARQGMNLPRKSVPLAIALSSVMPGAGKFYAGRTYDGIMSLLLVGLTGWQAYDGFRRGGRDSVKGWIYGAISAGFHAGNVYGAFVATRSYNKGLESDLLRKVELAIAVRGL